MDFKREAIDKLKCYALKKQSLRRTAEEILRLEEEAISIRSAPMNDMAVSGGEVGRDDSFVNNIALRSELAKAHQTTENWLNTVDAALKVLDEEELRMLDGMYIHPQKGYVEQLCEELHIEKTTLYTKRNLALRRFTLAMYGVTEQ